MSHRSNKPVRKMKGMFQRKRRFPHTVRIPPRSWILDRRHLSTSMMQETKVERKSSRVSTIIQGFTKEERLEACLLLVDNDPPEKLSEENLEVRLKKMFESADTDGDGDLTQEEFDSWFRKGLDSSTKRFPFDAVVKQSTDTKDKVERPTKEQIRAYSFRVALPFFGFGLIDNFLMLTFGDIIDLTLSQKLGVSMLFSAGLGNVFADSVGAWTSDIIEKFSDKFTPKSAKLTHEQLMMKSVRRRNTIFRIVGISSGCVVGMFPLLFL